MGDLREGRQYLRTKATALNTEQLVLQVLLQQTLWRKASQQKGQSSAAELDRILVPRK